MKNKKLTAKERETDRLGKRSERKACGRKWLATICLSSDRQMRMCMSEQLRQRFKNQ